MTVPVGGIRHRYIWDSLYNILKDSLTTLGWFAVSQVHAPINMIAAPVDHSLSIPPNTLTVSMEGSEGLYAELGSLFTEHQTTFFVDFFAENDVVGVWLINDIKDIIEGRMPSIGRTRPSFPVYDYGSAATPVQFTTCEIQAVKIDRGRLSTEGWKGSWFACSFLVIDYYTDQNG